MIEFTLEIGDRIVIGGDVIIELLKKIHPKAIPAQVARIGIEAPIVIVLRRGELQNLLLG